MEARAISQAHGEVLHSQSHGSPVPGCRLLLLDIRNSISMELISSQTSIYSMVLVLSLRNRSVVAFKYLFNL